VIDLARGYGFVNAHASPEPKGIIENMKNKRMDGFSLFVYCFTSGSKWYTKAGI